MLIGIDPRVTPALMDCLMRMGHGDELVIADSNFPADSIAATTRLGAPVYLPGFSTPEAVDLITTLMPLDAFGTLCAQRMEIDNAPEELGAVHVETLDIINARMPKDGLTGSLPRPDFYPRAARAFAVVATTEARPFGCFILRKGVVF